MGKSLSVQIGVVEYDINGAKVSFNPTDSEFVGKLYNIFDDMEKRQGEFQKRIDEADENPREILKYAVERDAEMRETIDGLLGEGSAQAIFGNMNTYALSDGLPAWLNLLFAIAEEIEAAFAESEKSGDPRMKEYDGKRKDLLERYKKATTKQGEK